MSVKSSIDIELKIAMSNVQMSLFLQLPQNGWTHKHNFYVQIDKGRMYGR